jgi:hypothetical protein
MSDGKSRIPSSKDSEDGAIENGEAPSSKPGAKRRASRAGTRSVATLTPEQLARKRANDREAQRNIRQRTRDHIESLEQRIRDLSGDRQDDRNVEEIQRRNEELEEELKRLKDILHALEDDIGPSPLTTSSMCMCGHPQEQGWSVEFHRVMHYSSFCFIFSHKQSITNLGSSAVRYECIEGASFIFIRSALVSLLPEQYDQRVLNNHPFNECRRFMDNRSCLLGIEF